jgi:serine/threonine protein kinase/tetratricopeptide (TPR) repeat protein
LAIDFPLGYTPERELGEGSMGQVWLARVAANNGHCAVKVLNLRNDRKGSAERSFNREVRAMARLEHPGIIEVFDFGRTEMGSPFVAMEYVSGSALNPYMRGPWTWGQLWNFLNELLTALAHAHARDIVHRDLKPGNIIVLPNASGPGSVKLADFGIALAISDARHADRRIEGTPAYIAPEAASGSVADIGPWTDLYSLGVMLFEILTGDLPYRGRHLLSHHQTSPLPQLKQRREVQAPSGLLKLVAKLLEKKPYRRFRSASEVIREIRNLGVPEPAPLNDLTVGFSFDDSYNDTAFELPKVQPTALEGWAGPGLFHLKEPHLVDRKVAQDRLMSMAKQTLAGQGPFIAIIEGDAGRGKSKLANWLREQVESSGDMSTMVIRSEPQSETGGGLREAVLRYLGAPTADKDATYEIFLEYFDDENQAKEAADTLWSSLTGDEVNLDLRLNRAVKLLQTLIGDTPFLLWADDAQWSPEGQVIRLLNRLGRPDGAQRMMLIVTLRPSERSTVRNEVRELMRLPNVERFVLSPVSPLALADALDKLAPLPPGLANAAAMMAAGNPLIALEAVRTFLEDEGLGTAPTDPAAVLKKRIDVATSGSDGPSLHSLLVRSTLLGRSFTLRSLDKLCKVPGDLESPELVGGLEQVEHLLEIAVNSGLLVEQEGKRWRFSHDLIRAELRKAAKGRLNWSALNLQAAHMREKRADTDPTGIELEVVARHYWEAQLPESALRLGLKGLSRLHAGGLMGHATSFARRLLKWNGECDLLKNSDQGELLLLASIAAEHAGQPRKAQEYASDAVEVARAGALDSLGARSAGRMGVLKLQQDEPESAEKWLWDALRFARASGESRALSDVHLSLGFFYQRRGESDLALTAYRMSKEMAQEHQLLEAEFAARSAIAGLERVSGNLESARQAFEDLADSALEAGLEVAALNARLQLGLCAWNASDPDEAKGHFEDVRRGARGNLFALEFYSALGLAWCYATAKKWSDVELCLIQAEDLRFDVRLKDPEAENLRVSIFDLAKASHREDLLERLEKLDMLTSRQSLSHDSV